MTALVLTAALFFAQDFGHEPKQSPDLRAQANAALEARDYAKAERLLEPLAAANPKDARLLYDLGSAQDALDQSTAAEASYRAASSDDPAMLEPEVALGLLLARAGKLQEAHTAFAAAVALPAGDPSLKARAYRALARIDQKARPADALDEILAALKLSPETPEDTLLTAELAQTEGDPADAEAAYRKLLANRPDDSETSAALAHLLLAEKRVADAQALLVHALAAHPGDPALTAQLAALYAGQGNTAGALPLVESLHRAHPTDANATRLLAGLELDSKNYAAAEPLLAQLSAVLPADPELADEHADALIHLKRFAEAQQILASFVAKPTAWPTPGALRLGCRSSGFCGQRK